MKQALWFIVVALGAGGLGWLWHGHRKWSERLRAEEHRMASFMADAVKSADRNGAPAPAVAPALPASAPAPQEKLLFEAAARAGEAGEPALAIQLYARLIARYPDSALAGQARAGVEAQKRKLAKG
jgi:hypothetical protein